jgi:hypothetical protein
MESINTNDSNQHIDIIVQLLEEDNTLSNIIIPSQNKKTNSWWNHSLKINFKKIIFILSIIGYAVFLYYSFQILFFKKIYLKKNIWFFSIIITCNDLFAILVLILYAYKKCLYINYFIGLSSIFGSIIIGWGIDEFFRMKTVVSSPLFTLFCILLLTNISFYSSFITWSVFCILS